MKNFIKALGIVAFIAVIGFSMASCGSKCKGDCGLADNDCVASCGGGDNNSCTCNF